MIFAVTEKNASRIIETYGSNCIAFDLTNKKTDLSECALTYDPCRILPDKDTINMATESKKDAKKVAKKAVKRAAKVLYATERDNQMASFAIDMTALAHILVSRDNIPADLSRDGVRKYISKVKNGPVAAIFILPEVATVNDKGDPVSKEEIRQSRNLVIFLKEYISRLFGLYGFNVLMDKEAKEVIKHFFKKSFNKKRMTKLWEAVIKSKKNGTGLTASKEGLVLSAIGHNAYAIHAIGNTVIESTWGGEAWNPTYQDTRGFVVDLIDIFSGVNILKMQNCGVTKKKVHKAMRKQNRTIIGYYNEIRHALSAKAEEYLKNNDDVAEIVCKQLDDRIDEINAEIAKLKEEREDCGKKRRTKIKKEITKLKDERKKISEKTYRKKKIKKAKRNIKEFNPFDLPKVKYGLTDKSKKRYKESGRVSDIITNMNTEKFYDYFADRKTRNNCALAIAIAHIKCRMDGMEIGSTKYNKIISNVVTSIIGDTDTAKSIVSVIKASTKAQD